MRQILPYLIICVVFLTSCNKKKFFDGPDSYADGFEQYTSVEELIDGDDERWSFDQITKSANGYELDTTHAHSGNQCLRFYAEPSDDEGASKCSIVKQKMAFWEGETVELVAWYYIEGTQSLDWIFLMDLEEQAAIGAGPGIRLANVGANNLLTIEHKYPNPNIDQSESTATSLPRNQWVEIKMVVHLSAKKKGWIRLYQDGNLIIEQDNWKTLPTDLPYFQQGTKRMYSSIEFGITANSFDNATVLYLDDVSVKTL